MASNQNVSQPQHTTGQPVHGQQGYNRPNPDPNAPKPSQAQRDAMDQNFALLQEAKPAIDEIIAVVNKHKDVLAKWDDAAKTGKFRLD